MTLYRYMFLVEETDQNKTKRSTNEEYIPKEDAKMTKYEEIRT